MKGYSETKYTKQIQEKHYLYGHKLASWIHNRFFKKPGKILDIGCSRGRFGWGFKKLGYESYGIDYDSKAILTAKERGVHAKVSNVEIKKLPYPDNYFNYIFARNVVEHIKNYQHLFSEIKRVLKKGGKLFVLTDDFETRVKTFYGEPSHLKPYTLESLRRIARYFDFKVIYLNKFKHPPFIWRYFNNIFNLRIPWGKQDLVFVGENERT